MKKLIEYSRLLDSKYPITDKKVKRYIFCSRIIIPVLPNIFFTTGAIYGKSLIYFDCNTFEGFVRLIGGSWLLYLLLFLISYIIYTHCFKNEKYEKCE